MDDLTRIKFETNFSTKQLLNMFKLWCGGGIRLSLAPKIKILVGNSQWSDNRALWRVIIIAVFVKRHLHSQTN